MSLPDKVGETIFRYSMVRPGMRLGIALSGGIDSVCLLDVMTRLSQREGWRLELSILHLNHSLRGAESDGDEAFVRRLALEHGLPCFCERASPSPGNLEDQARVSRLQFFARAIGGGFVERIATGHTSDDQAETVLFRLLRGTGLTGLAGVWPVTAEGLIRPMLDAGRSEVLEYAQANQLAWREDSSNRDLGFARNRLRHEWLPSLQAAWNPQLSQSLANLARLAHAEEEYWRRKIGALAEALVRRSREGLVFAAAEIQCLDDATQRRLLRWVHGELGGAGELGFDHVEDLRELCRTGRGDGRVLAPGIDAMRSYEWVKFSGPGMPGSPERFWSLCLPVGERVATPGGEILLQVVSSQQGQGADCLYNEGSRTLDREHAWGELVVRSWRPGDRLNGRKIKELFQGARIPLWERAKWPVVVAGDDVVWTRRFGVADRFRPRPGSTNLLRIQEVDPC